MVLFCEVVGPLGGGAQLKEMLTANGGVRHYSLTLHPVLSVFYPPGREQAPAAIAVSLSCAVLSLSDRQCYLQLWPK